MTHVRLEAVTRLETPVALLVIAVKAYDLDEALDRVAPAALDGALILPLQNGLEHVAAIRARAAHERAHAAGPTLRRGRVDRPRVRVVARAGSGRPGDAHGCDDRRRLASSWSGRGARRAARAARCPRDRGRRRRRRGRGALGEGGTAVGARRRDGRGRRSIGALRDDRRVASAPRGGARRGVRGRRRPTASSSTPLANGRSSSACPTTSTTSAARDAAAGRRTELDAIAGSVVRAGVRLGVPTPVLAELLEEASCRAS